MNVKNGEPVRLSTAERLLAVKSKHRVHPARQKIWIPVASCSITTPLAWQFLGSGQRVILLHAKSECNLVAFEKSDRHYLPRRATKGDSEHRLAHVESIQ